MGTERQIYINEIPRKVRLSPAASFFHVMARGIEGRDIFATDEDRERFLGLLSAGLNRSSDVHLSAPMRPLNAAYAQGFSRVHNRSGYLFQCVASQRSTCFFWRHFSGPNDIFEVRKDGDRKCQQFRCSMALSSECTSHPGSTIRRIFTSTTASSRHRSIFEHTISSTAICRKNRRGWFWRGLSCITKG